MTKQRVLITGAGGLIGRILGDGLADEFELYGVDLEPCAERKVFRADVAELEELLQVLHRLPSIDRIVHLAADPRVDAPWDSVLRNNIVGTRNVYEAARQFGIPGLVFASSNHVTGANERRPPQRSTPLRSSDPIAPDSYYGVGKAFGEALARFFREVHGVRSICLRIGAVLPDDDPGRSVRLRKIWLSHRDLVQLVRLSLRAELAFGIFYGISDNRDALWDITEARRQLGYQPQDDASTRRASGPIGNEDVTASK